MLLEGLVRQWGIPMALYSDRHAASKYNARQKPVPVETTQFARVMRDLGIQQIFALSPQAKRRVGADAGNLLGPAGHRAAPWLAPAPSTRPRRSSRSFCRSSTPGSPSWRSTPRRPTGWCRTSCR